jgi:hypothetical protein
MRLLPARQSSRWITSQLSRARLAACLFLATAVLQVDVAGTACGQTFIVATEADVVNYGICSAA